MAFANGPRNNPSGLRVPGRADFQRFATPEAGIQAQEHQLGRYMQRGLTTVRQIVETWAPRRRNGGDNPDRNVDNYIAHVAGRLGVSPDQPLSPADIQRFGVAQREFETGHR